MPKKPKSAPPRAFPILSVRPEVISLLEQVENDFEALHNIRPTHSATLVNALMAYKAQLKAA